MSTYSAFVQLYMIPEFRELIIIPVLQMSNSRLREISKYPKVTQLGGCRDETQTQACLVAAPVFSNTLLNGRTQVIWGYNWHLNSSLSVRCYPYSLHFHSLNHLSILEKTLKTQTHTAIVVIVGFLFLFFFTSAEFSLQLEIASPNPPLLVLTAVSTSDVSTTWNRAAGVEFICRHFNFPGDKQINFVVATLSHSNWVMECHWACFPVERPSKS